MDTGVQSVLWCQLKCALCTKNKVLLTMLALVYAHMYTFMENHHIEEMSEMC